MATTTVNTPPQVEAIDTSVLASEGSSVTVTPSGTSGEGKTEVLILHKKTPTGKNGSITIKNGIVTSWTLPT